MSNEKKVEISNASKYTVFPIEYPNLWAFYKNHIAAFWTVEEIRLTDDLKDWENLNDNERFFIKNILAFFASSDGIVNENLLLNFYNEIEIAEARQYYAVQMMMESIHSEQYALLIETYIKDGNEKSKLFNAINTVPAIKKKADWAIKWISEGSSNIIPDEVLKGLQTLKAENELGENALKYFLNEKPSLAQRLIAFICVEGIFFSGSFCAIYWLKARGILPGLCTANQFIARDENIHVEFAIELFKTLNLKEKVNKKVVIDIFTEAVEIEKEFINESIPASLIGMNKNLMSKYIEYIADRWLTLLGYKKLYKSENPFGFMELISVNTRENFFELNVSQYKRSGVGTNEAEREIKFDDDF